MFLCDDAAGRVRLTHDDPVDVAARHGIDPADPGIQRMIAAFAALTAVAACES